ncbi:MAG: aminotransferase class I/II-fold pyridoxal phosphate-dependent enzyme [Bacteroidota bacterium]
MQPGSFDKLEQRRTEGVYRRLSSTVYPHDFWSNDYLGISRSLAENSQAHSGSSGSRLISGNSAEAESCEHFLADFFGAEAALVFNSGYDANLGLFSSLTTRHDLVLYDEYVHASVRDGIRLGLGKSFSFLHNDTSDLEKKLRQFTGKGISVFIAVESLYSMDGDFAPLQELAALAETYGAFLIVDEAHAGGVFGPEGKGLCPGQGLTSVFARVVTFGKAYGTHGASVLGSAQLKDFLVNFARSFIYTTALPPQQYLLIREAVKASLNEELRESLFRNIRLFVDQNKEYIRFSDPRSPIQVLFPGDRKELDRVCTGLQSHGIGVKVIQSPTVPKGKERIRVCLHAFNTPEEIQLFSELLHSNQSST